MSDSYEQFRSLSLASVAPLLGIDLSRFKKRKGGELYGPCPIHHPKANQTSFSYSADGKFFCFSCSAKGRGAIDLAMQVLHIGFKEAVERLGGVKAQPQPQSEPISDSGASEGHSTLQPLKSSYHKFKEESPWLAARIPSPEVLERYQVFAYHNPARKSVYSHKVMIPIKGFDDGEVYGYLARTPEPKEGEPKYLFPKGLPKHLFVFGAHELKDGAPHKLVYAGESPWMVMRFAMMGFPAVALYGWSASPEQIEILASLARGVYYLPDRNKSGPECATVIQAIAKRLWVKAPPLPDGVDDAEFLSTEQIKAL